MVTGVMISHPGWHILWFLSLQGHNFLISNFFKCIIIFN